MRMRRAYWARLDGRKRVIRSLSRREGKPGGSGEAGYEGSERGGGV